MHNSLGGEQAVALACKNASLLAGSAVSSSVPSAKTTRMSFRVWYVFWLTPQHIPLELLDTMPPTMQLSMEDGSAGTSSHTPSHLSQQRSLPLSTCKPQLHELCSS